MTLTDIEKKWDFKYPPIFHQLWEDGMFSYGDLSEGWNTVVYPKIKDYPPLFLHCYDFELHFSTEIIEEELELFYREDEYCHVLPDIKLVPFGMTGAHDLYCFYFNGQIGEDIPIVYIENVEDEGVYLAKNLNEYIFIRMLYELSEIEVPSDEIELAEYWDNYKATLRSHSKYMTTEQVLFLESLHSKESKEIIVYNYKGEESFRYNSVLTEEEFKKYRDLYCPYDKYEERFVFMVIS
ncbi:SMI1/KNR4 family protein [Myroides odoratimimus]|uniref:Knr4/Smi1-like domain-containing protein n=1 Tax=Myroides odoratimimus CIP 101113 TaxID=883154 RepID=A0AAV3EYQ5_9FLAO|nr:SMI1/KNR4 family protein [Myroides odoratimimus]EHO05304.1 hypothetical protein HMPREF9715_03374 [Myroides odoratimimus CIP 101113]